MVNLYEWAKRWGVPTGAIDELREQMGQDDCRSAFPDATSEAGVSQRVRLAYANSGGLLWRNNVGAFKDDNDNWVRYGLANDSQKMNKSIKSSDLIGVRPVTITPEMVGTVIGQFVAIECKHPHWQYTGTDHEVAQLKFLQLVMAKGGLGYFQQ